MSNSIDFAKEFPVVGKYTYLNTAASGLLPRSVANWRHAHDEAFVQQGSLFRDNHKDHLNEIKKDIAHFFDASERQVALVPNFSFGLNVLLEGIPKGKKVLLVERDYPSINWPVEYRDFEIEYVPLNQHFEESIAGAFKTFQPDFFMCSMVQYINGIKIDMGFLKELKDLYPDIILIGDGTQYFGTESYSFAKGPFDIVGSSCYKWLLAGYGNGFMILGDGMEHRIAPKAIGFNSADAVFGKKEDINLIGRFEPGHQDTLNYGSLRVALQLLTSIGKDLIEQRVNSLSNVAFNRFKELGWLESSVANRKQHSSIFNIKGNESLYMKLKTKGIITSQRGKGLRVSFHFYNSEQDLDCLIRAIQEAE